MKKLYISESERIEILKKHSSKILSEQNQPAQQTNYSISDLQNALIKAGQNPGKVDGQFGPATLGAAEKAIGSTISPTSTTTTPATTASTTPDVIKIDPIKKIQTKDDTTSLKVGADGKIVSTNVGGGGSTSSSSL